MARRETPRLSRAESRGCSIAVVIHTLPFATTGEDHPRPATGVFHAMFLVSFHSSGRLRSEEWPCPSGPRNAGQSCAATDEADAITSAATIDGITRVCNDQLLRNRLTARAYLIRI